MPSELPQHARIAIIGAGFSGLGAAIKLRERGIEDFVVLERAKGVGGAWHHNTYPGCQCDIPSNLYSFSFALNPEWSRTFPLQPEIHDYLRATAERFGIVPKIRFGHELVAATWDTESERWQLETGAGSMSADIVIAGVGGLSDPQIPAVPGLEDFGGEVFHSARWNHDHDPAGKRVAVIGTGASAIQFLPRIRKEAKQVTLFQRTQPWIMPHPDRAVSDREKQLYRRFPALQQLVRRTIYWTLESRVPGFRNQLPILRVGEQIALRHIASAIEDPELRKRVTPSYRMGCKRILLSNDWYPALAAENVEVVPAGLTEVRGNTLVGADGSEAEVDSIIFGTGFHVTDPPIAAKVRGADGETLEEHFSGSPRAHRGTTFAGFPNFFMMTGPNTGLGHNSVVVMIEAQLRYLMSALTQMDERGIDVVDARPEAQEAWNREIDRQLEGTVWNAGGCASWYIDRKGRNATLWPSYCTTFERKLRHFELGEYVTSKRRAEAPAAEPAVA